MHCPMDDNDRSNHERRGGERAHVAIEADLRKPGRTPFKVLIRDLSETGGRAETLAKIHPGDNVMLTLPGLAPISATIRWTTSREFGLQWASPLHPSVFDHIKSRFPDLFR